MCKSKNKRETAKYHLNVLVHRLSQQIRTLLKVNTSRLSHIPYYLRQVSKDEPVSLLPTVATSLTLTCMVFSSIHCIMKLLCDSAPLYPNTISFKVTNSSVKVKQNSASSVPHPLVFV